MKGKSQEIPLPFCREAIVVGPASEGIQKKPSVRSPLKVHENIEICKVQCNIKAGLLQHFTLLHYN